MASMLLRRSSAIRATWNNNYFQAVLSHSSSFSSYSRHTNNPINPISSDEYQVPSKGDINGLSFPPFLEDGRAVCSGEIELVDTDSWRISSSLAEAWKEKNTDMRKNNVSKNLVDEKNSVAEGYSDFDEIDDMRVEGKLFYKIDRGSKEYEEYSYDFHRRKKPDSNSDKKENENNVSSNTSKQQEEQKESKNKGNRADSFIFENQYEMGNFGIEKKARAPTFNQLTAPYHEPFCLDIYVSKGSVRACIVHRATSNVVAVAHSISKDMKFDFSSKRNSTTCVAVGALLAQRALADDIHNVVFTPRKGDKIEGKLQIVLQSVIDNGVNVKVKLKQRQMKRVGHLGPVWQEKN